MSYRITINGDPFCSSEFEHSAVLNPKVVLEVNKSGSLTFTMTPEHPYYNGIEFRQSLFDVYQNDELIFEGVPVSETTDFWNRKTVVCEGELTFLNDTIQRQAVYQNQTVQSLLSSYLSVHNAQADASKQFTVGSVTVSGGNTIYRYTNYQSTMQELQEDLIENFGGYFRIRHSGGVRYLDYLDSSPHNSSQTIRIGKNLVDFSRNLSSLDICTVLIPLGAKTGNQLIDCLDERLDIKSVNGNLDYLVGTAQAYYGNIWRTQVWDDVTTAAALKTKGQNYLDDVQWANLVISATAFDLGLATEDVEQFHVLDMIKVVSEPHGIDRYFMLTKLEMDLDHPASTKITLGKDERLSLSAKTAKAEATIERQPTNILVNASENARQILDNATDGAIQILFNQNGIAYELRINNSQNPATATKWWRYNSGGWAFTADAGQTYVTAATNDGTIFATLIKAGILSSDNGKFYVNLDTGAATLSDVTLNGGSITLGNGTFSVSSGGAVNASDMTITGGSVTITGSSTTDGRVSVTYEFTDAGNNKYTYKSILKPAMLVNSYDLLASGGGTSHAEADLRYDRLTFVDGSTEQSSYEDTSAIVRNSSATSQTTYGYNQIVRKLNGTDWFKSNSYGLDFLASDPFGTRRIAIQNDGLKFYKFANQSATLSVFPPNGVVKQYVSSDGKRKTLRFIKQVTPFTEDGYQVSWIKYTSGTELSSQSGGMYLTNNDISVGNWNKEFKALDDVIAFCTTQNGFIMAFTKATKTSGGSYKIFTPTNFVSGRTYDIFVVGFGTHEETIDDYVNE